MNREQSQKIRAVATHVNDLNEQGQVKAQSANEHGYAGLVDIARGCRVWAHHTLKDELLVDLMLTRAMAVSKPKEAFEAVVKFTDLANSAGYQVIHRVWHHSIDENDVRQQYCIDLTNETITKVIEVVDAIRQGFRNGS